MTAAEEGSLALTSEGESLEVTAVGDSLLTFVENECYFSFQ
jgi:hypothetical protein